MAKKRKATKKMAYAVFDLGGLQEGGNLARHRLSIFSSKKKAARVAGAAKGSWRVVPCTITFRA